MALAWPVTIGLVLRQRRFRALGPRPPLAEDSGFDGLAVMMARNSFSASERLPRRSSVRPFIRCASFVLVFFEYATSTLSKAGRASSYFFWLYRISPIWYCALEANSVSPNQDR